MSKRLLIALLSLAILLFFAALWSLRGSRGQVRGDEGTYLAMAESLALDGDLWFDERDQSRLEADSRAGRKAVILQRVGERVAYSKPVLYPLVAAPFYRLLGERGLVAVNGLALACGLGLLAGFLRRRAPGSAVGLTVVSYAGLGLLVVYVPWRTSDALQAAATLSGLALCLWDLPEIEVPRSAARRGGARLLLGGALLGVVTSLRLTNGLIAVIPLLVLWLHRRRRDALGVAAAVVLTLVAGAGVSTLLAGAPSPYTAVRATFTPATGYPAGGELEAPRSPFDYDRASYDRTKKLIEAPRASAYSAVYFLVGRHTGVLLYFPLAAALVFAALRRPDRTGWVVLTAVAGLGLFYLLFLPFNYFGGATCVGNRYFLVSYAALPFALRRPLGRVPLLASWGLALLVAGSALLSLADGPLDGSTQNHAYAGVFRLMPYESTAASIDGGRDVFWNKELGRFVDPHAAVSRWSFRLRSQRPPSQIQVANLRREDTLRFLVLSAAPRLELVYRDWRQRVVVPLERPVGERGLVEIEPARPLRRHPLWFRNVWDHGLPYTVRDFTLAIRTPDGEPAEAEIRYLGTEPWPRDVFAREVLELTLPERVVAGSDSRVPVRVRNDSAVPWLGRGVFPVFLSYRLELDGGSGAATEGPRVPLAQQVVPGAAASRSLLITWPDQPGRYRLTVDLMIEGVAWFAGRVGEPLAEAVVVVEAPAPG